MPSYRNATVILPSPLTDGALAHLRTLEGLDLHLPVAPGAAAQPAGARAQSGHLTVFVERGVITGALTLPGSPPPGLSSGQRGTVSTCAIRRRSSCSSC